MQEQYDREVAEMLQAQMMADTRQQNAMYAHTDFQPASMFDESLVYGGSGLGEISGSVMLHCSACMCVKIRYSLPTGYPICMYNATHL